MLELNKVYCMDCIEFLKKLPDNSVDLIVTDPPYKLSQRYGTSVDADNLMSVSTIMVSMREFSRILKKGRFAVIFYDKRILPLLFQAVKYTELRYDDQIFLYRRWGNAHKRNGWMSCTDPIIIFKKGDDKPFRPDHKVKTKHDTYTKSSPEKNSYNHPAQKPMEIITDIINQFSNKEELVCDPYMGSGTVAECSMNLSRKWIGCDNSKEYINITNKRLSQETLLPLDVNTKEDGFPPTPKGMGIQPTIL